MIRTRRTTKPPRRGNSAFARKRHFLTSLHLKNGSSVVFDSRETVLLEAPPPQRRKRSLVHVVERETEEREKGSCRGGAKRRGRGREGGSNRERGSEEGGGSRRGDGEA